MSVPFYPADILLPKEKPEKWSVIACDQYTSDAEYWNEVEKFTEGAPSSLRVTLPEIYLGAPDEDERVKKINSTMNEYLENGVFNIIPDSFVYVERTLKSDLIRKGIVGTVDLEYYDYNPGSKTLIRATERTVPERIPPRVKIRSGASLELPHVMILIDDPGMTVIEPFANETRYLEKLYDFELMKNSGHLTGWRINGEHASELKKRMEKLASHNNAHDPALAPLLFAVGDGNHSLATAKTCWEEIKKTLTDEQKKTHPARFALAEIVNLHDASLEFEPIHRVVFNTDPQRFLREMTAHFNDKGLVFDNGDVDENNDFIIISSEYEHVCRLKKRHNNLTLGDVQEFLSHYISDVDKAAKLDYIHGDSAAVELGELESNVALLMPVMSKNELFKTVMTDGTLPRKTFSMGEADDKRFYLEAKRIK